MTCNCNSTNYSIPRVVRGNDFTLIVAVKKPVLADGVTELEDFDLTECTDIKVNIVTRLGRKTERPYTVDGNKLLVQFDETVSSGLYGLEITGKKDDADWRFYAAPGEVIEIVEPTSLAYAPTGSYSVLAEVGVISLPDALIAKAVDKANTAAKNANDAVASMSEYQKTADADAKYTTTSTVSDMKVYSDITTILN